MSDAKTSNRVPRSPGLPRLARLALARLPASLQATYDALPEAVVLLGADGRIALANRAFRAMVGETEPLTGRALEGIRAVRFGLPKRNAPPWLGVLAGQAESTGLRLILRRSPQDTRAVLASSSALHGPAGVLVGAMVVFVDRTEIERAQTRWADTVAALTERNASMLTENDDLRRLAMTDSLSGALNRRAFFAQAELAFQDSIRDDRPLSAVLADVDYFKSVNDGYGHQVGDRAIRSCAQILMAAVRSEDLVCRYGGEEFAILLPNRSGAEAAEVAERLRLRIEAEAGQALTPEGPIRLTMSFGVAERLPLHASLEQLVAEADRLLYRAKRRGRNQVCLLNRDQGATTTVRVLRLPPEASPSILD